MLAEYVLLPCIFDTTCFNNPELCHIYLKNIRDILLHEEALVRDLYNGKWSKYVKELPSQHPNTKYILKNLAQHLRRVRAAKANLPTTFVDWCNEALSSHKEEPYNGIVASSNIANQFKSDDNLVASIEKLEKATWWTNRSHSVGLNRNINDYLKHLKLILSYANSIMFIDPYFNPANYDYREFHQILKAICRPEDPPDIEIHLCNLSVSQAEYEQQFRQKLSTVIQAEQLKVEVFIWDYFHDRFIITNVIGIQSGHSFSISGNPKELTTWTRLGRSRKDELLKEFSKNSMQHKLQHQFTVS